MKDQIIQYYNIIVSNLTENCEQNIFFSSKENNKIFIDDESICAKIKPGTHKLTIKRHNSFFFDWFMDDVLIEEFLVYHLATDEESTLIFSSILPLYSEEDYKDIEFKQNSSLPILLSLQNLSFNLIYNKPSQLSMFFYPIINTEKYFSITFIFNKDYCKVYLDCYINNKYDGNLRKNLSLFNTEQGIDNKFIFDIEKNTLTISNIKTNKIYNLEEIILSSYKEIEIKETYAPNGPGIYLITKL